jgi:membrane-associated phospholipid phosphatase
LAQIGLVLSLMVVLIAILVSVSRYQLRIHTAREVVAGAAIGGATTLILYLMFN